MRAPVWTHANEHAVAILAARGWDATRIAAVTGGKPIRWTRHVARDLWERFGDGRDFDALLAEDDLQIERDRQRSRSHKAHERTSPLCIMKHLMGDQDRTRVEAELEGPIDDAVWEQACERAARFRRSDGTPRHVDAATDLLHDIEARDRACVSRGVSPAHWTSLLIGLYHAHQRVPVNTDLVLAFPGAGLPVDMTGAAPEIAAAFRECGVAMVGTPVPLR